MPAPYAYDPTPDDVALMMRARTRDRAGNEGTWTATTRPTAAEVGRIIDLVSAQVRAEVGPEIPDVIADEARAVIIDGAASRIEAAFFPEQNQGPDSPAGRYDAWFRDGLATLGRSRAAWVASGSRGGGVGIGSMPLLGTNGLP